MKEADHSTFASINVADCCLVWQDANGKDLRTRRMTPGENVFAVVTHATGIIYREHRQYCHIDDAWQILAAGRPAKWKTAAALLTLRQALRERYVQGMPLDKPNEGIGQIALSYWMIMARKYDAQHHGQCTF